MIALLLAVTILGADDGLGPLLDQPADAYALAYARHKREGVPLVVLVSADWCGPCQQLKAVLQPWALRRDLAFVVIDIEHSAAAQIMVGKSVPQLVAYRNGRRHSIVGYGPPRGSPPGTPSPSLADMERTLLGE